MLATAAEGLFPANMTINLWVRETVFAADKPT
jgi:hypothetical protein